MFKNVTPQGWLLAAVVLIPMLVSSVLILMGAAQGKYELVTIGIGLMSPILSAFGVYQVVKPK